MDVFKFMNDEQVKAALSKAIRDQGFICNGYEVEFKKRKKVLSINLQLKESINK